VFCKNHFEATRLQFNYVDARAIVNGMQQKPVCTGSFNRYGLPLSQVIQNVNKAINIREILAQNRFLNIYYVVREMRALQNN
jgi:hypothetical protein